MKKLLFLVAILFATLSADAQYRGTRQNVPLVRTEDYVTNSPGNSIANSKLVAYYKDSTAMGFVYPSIEFSNFKSNRNDGIPNRVLWLDDSGFMKISPLPNYLLKETDPLWTSDKINYYDKSTSDSRYLQSFNEIDPSVPLFVKAITTGNITNWNTAFGWGNHASVGYLTSSIAASTYQPLLGYTPYNSTNPTGYITSTALTPYQLTNGLGTLAFSSATIPTNTNQLTNGAGYITGYIENDPIWNTDKPNFRTKTQNDLLYQPIGTYLSVELDPTVPAYAKTLTSSAVIKATTDPLYKTISYTPSWSDITSKPTFATVAISGDYNDLANKPSIPTIGRIERYIGVTSGSGTYTVVYPTPFSTVPHVNPVMIGATPTNSIRITAFSTTGFTITANNTINVLGLLPSYPTLNGLTIDVLVVEK